ELTLSTDAVNESCAGQMDGSATVIPAGGTGNYTYTWGPTTGSQNTATASNLGGGSYGVIVSDANGCSVSTSVAVANGSTMRINSSGQDPACTGATDGSATVNVSGGFPPFTYLWDDANASTTAQLNNLGVGDYSVTVSDSRGCNLTEMVSLTAPSSLNVSNSTTDASCFNSADGGVQFNVSGGAPPYTFAWSDAGAALSTRNDLLPGNYDVTITDDTGCGTIETVEVMAPSPIVLTMSSTPLSCFESADGVASVSAAGGAGNYQYRWNDPFAQNNASANGLSAGTWEVTVTDASGCTQTGNVELTQPEAIMVDVLGQQVSCDGAIDGTANVTMAGGTGTYTYQWNDPNNQSSATATNLAPGNYTLVVTDASGCSASSDVQINEPDPIVSSTSIVSISCAGTDANSAEVSAFGGTGSYSYNWSDANGQTTRVATDLPSGKYYVTINDMMGCSQVDSIDIQPPAPIFLSLIANETSCHGGSDGSISGLASGGSGSLNFQWDNGSNSEVLTGLSANRYCVTVTDENGCSTSECASVSEPNPMEANENITAIDCHDNANGAIRLSPSGGLAPFTYQWTGPAGYTSDAGNITDLAGGDYAVTVVDAEGCSLTKVLSLDNPPPLAIEFTTEPVSCYGESTGSIQVSADGGTLPYRYRWANGQLTDERTGLAAGAYLVTITDGAGCSVIDSTVINQPAEAFEASFEVEPISCNGASDGAVVFSASGGTPDYQYSIDGTTFSPYPTAFGLAPGQYDLYVQDAQGCMLDSLGVELTDPPAVEVN
ncbi:MAG: SprB repeat-containing protein, partial [Bacteroidota bacterium]